MPQAIYATGGGASGNAVTATSRPPGGPTLLRLDHGRVVFAGEGRRYGGVLMQLGRVQTDADFNDATDVDRKLDLSAMESIPPEVSDQVAVGFEHGQMRSPVVVAPLWSSVDKPPTNDTAGAQQADLQSVSSHLDSTSEMGETESLRLQMAMDRLSKMMNTLSNLLHRIETTDAAITRNVK